MKKLILLATLIPSLSFAYEVATLRYSEEFIMDFVLKQKFLERRPEIPLPITYYESKTPLKQFQDIMEAQWGFRPDRFTNAFSITHNHVYLTDNAEYYRRTGRCMDDSMAHEFVHYLQVKYQGWNQNDESTEWQAVDIQTAFREEYCKDSLATNLNPLKNQ